MILSKPPGGSRLLLALGLSVALFSATFIALDRSTSSAQQAPGTTTASTGNVNNLPLHDGTQKGGIFTGSGRILPLNQEIQIRAVVENFQPGFFNDPKTQYGVDPQRLNDQGNLQGHNHACIQRIPENGQLDTRCDSFVVLEQEGTTNVISGVGPPITVAGRYRVCVDDASGAHYVAVRGFAQQGGPVDCVRVLFMRLRTRR